MKRKNAWGWLLAVGLPLVISACSDDDPPAKAGLTFEKAEEEVTESDGTPTSFHPDDGKAVGLSGTKGRDLTVKLLLDKELSADAVIAYTVTGTASSVNPSGDEVNDYMIPQTGDNYTLDDKQITLKKGAKEINLKVTMYEDLVLEYDDKALNNDKLSFETVILTLTSVVSGPVELGQQTSYTMKVVEDDAVFILTWGVAGGNTQGDVDMDLLFWADDQLIWGSATEEEYEARNFPAGFPSGTYGVSYTYYSGTSDDVRFAVGLWSTSSTIDGKHYTWPDANPLVFEGRYGLKNINKWDAENAARPVVVQTFTKNGLNYSGVSAIQTLDAGSRKTQPVLLKNSADVSAYLKERHTIGRIKSASAVWE